MWWLAACGWPTELSGGTADPVCAPVAAKVDADRLVADVAVLAGAPRRDERRKEAVRAWLAGRFAEAGYSAETLPFTISGVSGTNVVARGRADARVLLAAHYDTVEGSPGADDDASGVAVVLEVARVLGPGVPVAFALFDAEEPHRATVGSDARNFAFGSQAFVDGSSGWDTVFVLDAVGYACHEPGCQRLPTGLPPWFDARGDVPYWVANTPSSVRWADLAATAGLGGLVPRAFAVPDRGSSVRQSRFSDHAPFWDAGVDAVLVTDTALLRNPHYHRATDTEVDRDFLAGVARGTASAVASAAGLCRP